MIDETTEALRALVTALVTGLDHSAALTRAERLLRSTVPAEVPPPPATLASGTMPPAGPPSQDVKALSKREFDCLEGLSRGMTYPEIAHAFQISENTVRHHVRNLYTKLGVDNRAAAVMKALTYMVVR